MKPDSDIANADIVVTMDGKVLKNRDGDLDIKVVVVPALSGVTSGR